jgi:hypothetical protein
MEAAFIKLITIFLSLGTVGVEPNPQAPAPAEVLRYAPASADAMVFVDFGAFVPNNYKALTGLPNEAAIKADKESRESARELVQMVESGRAMVKGMTGVDLASDLGWAAAWVRYPDAGDPRFLITVRGNFPNNLLDRAASAMGEKLRSIGAGKAIQSPDGNQMVGVTADGTVLVGTTSWVKARLGKRWKSRARFRRLPKVFDRKPFLVVASSPSRRAVRRFSREISDPEAAALRDLLTGHRFAALALTHDGVEWTWAARSTAGHDRAVQISDGLIDLMRAAHLATRGFVKLALGVAESYRKEPMVAAILGYEKQILAVVDAVSGDGSFKVKVDDQRRKRTLHVRAWDKELSDVLPMAGAAPMVGAAAMFWLTAAGSPQPLAPQPATARPPRP